MGLRLTESEDAEEESDEPCRTCIEANLKKSDIPRRRTRTITKPLEVVGADLQALDCTGHDGSRHLAVYADHHTGLLVTQTLKHKSEQASAAKQELERVEAATNHRVNTLRADQGG